MNEQELITVIEDDEESVAESDTSVIKNGEGLKQFILELIEEGVVYEMILLHSDKVVKV